MIDAHHHLWSYDPAEYPWMADGPGNDRSALRRDYGPPELEAVTAAVGVTRTVVVQARQSLGENASLVTMRAHSDRIAGVVGWVPLADPGVGEVLDEWADRLVGVRHVVQDEPDGFLDGQDFNRGVAMLPARGLVYDLLVYPRQLGETVRFVDRHPDVSFVLDHAAKPRIGPKYDAEWDRRLRELAERPNVACKVSGLATEVTLPKWDAALLRPYFDALVEAFTPARLMWGSDWPVALLATGYERWHAAAVELAGPLSDAERADLFGKTAERAYDLA